MEKIIQRLSLSIPGKPLGKQRPKFCTRGGMVRAFTPSQTVRYEELVKAEYFKNYNTAKLPEGKTLSVYICAYYPMRKNVSKKQAQRMINGDVKPGVKPDADNIAKAICDALNGIAYKDDALISALSVKKAFSTVPRVEVFIEAVEDKG